MGRVNTAVYGAKDLWLDGGSYDDNVRLQDKFMQPNFTDSASTDASVSYLKTAIDNGRLKLNKSIDTSPVWSALGTEAPLSHINNYHYYLSEAPELRTTDDTEAFKWSFGRSLQSYAYALDIRNKNMMFAPSNDYAAIRFTGEYQGVRPMVNTPIKNAVLFPYVFVRAGLALTDSTRILSLADYVNPDNTYTTDYPYITHCFFQVYYNSSTELVSDTHFRNIWINDAYKCLIEYNANTVYQGKKIGDKTFGKSLQYHYSFCNFSGSTYGITFIGCLNSAQSYHGSISSGYEKNQYVIRFTSDMTVSWLSDNANYMVGYIQYYDGFEEYVKRALACFGMFFTTDLQTAQSGQLNDEKMCLGILVDGVGHGDYSTGSGNEEQEQWEWESSEDSEYVPEPDTEFADFGDLESMTHNIGGTLAGITTYNMTAANLDLLIKWLNSEESGETGQNYAQYIMSIKYSAFGFEPRSTSDETIKVGGHLVNVGTTAVKGRRGFRLNGWTTDAYPINRYWNDFRDFEPYTTIALKLPFGDTIQLNCGEWYGHTMRVRYSTDEISGSGVAMIYRDNLQWMSVNLTTYTDIPLSALNAGSYHNTLIQAKTTRNSALIGIGASALSVGASASSGNVVGAAASGAGLLTSIERYKQSDYALNHMTKSISRIGSSGDISDFLFEWRPNIIFERRAPLTYDKTVYKNTVGYACLKTGKLSQFSGLTVCSDVKLSDFGATAEEKRMIKEALSKGVYL